MSNFVLKPYTLPTSTKPASRKLKGSGTMYSTLPSTSEVPPMRVPASSTGEILRALKLRMELGPPR